MLHSCELSLQLLKKLVNVALRGGELVYLLRATLHSCGCIILGKHVGDTLIIVLVWLGIVVEAFLICYIVLSFLGVVLCSTNDG